MCGLKAGPIPVSLDRKNIRIRLFRDSAEVRHPQFPLQSREPPTGFCFHLNTRLTRLGLCRHRLIVLLQLPARCPVIILAISISPSVVEKDAFFQ